MTYYSLHKESIVLDSHCDTPLRLLDNKSIVHRSNEGHVDLERMWMGGVTAAFFAIYTPNSLAPDAATTRALTMIAKVYDFVADNVGQVAIARTPKDVYDLKVEDKLGILFGMENGAPIQKDLSLLRLFYRLGVRYMTLTHSRSNEICDSCTEPNPKWNGLSPFGIELVQEMNHLGMMIDVSHVSDATFYDVLKYSKAPVLASHSCCRSLCDVPRNMTDQMIKDLAKAGGVIQINFYPAFLDKEYAVAFGPLCDKFEELQALWRQDSVKYESLYKEAKEEMEALQTPSYKRVVDHIDHVVSLVGSAHVGLGSDFDGIDTTPRGLSDISEFPNVTKELMRRGYSEKSIRGILGANLLRLFSNCMKISNQIQTRTK